MRSTRSRGWLSINVFACAGAVSLVLITPAAAVEGSELAGLTNRAAIADLLPQRAIGCEAMPKKIERNRLVVLRKKACVTEVGNSITVTITPSKAGLGKIKTSRKGRVTIRTTSTKGRLIVAMTAPGSDTHLGYGMVRTVKIK